MQVYSNENYQVAIVWYLIILIEIDGRQINYLSAANLHVEMLFDYA